MITESTVLVLGAGASIPYGFPSGPDLIKSILEDLPDTPNSRPFPTSPRRENIYEYLCGIHGRDEVIAFRRALGRSGKISIDAFLESNSSTVREVGKAAIAAEILSAEDPVAMTTRSDQDWYRYFYSNVLGCSLNNLLNNKLTVITYNYDRSFEYFLVQSFAADCCTTHNAAAEIVSQLPIYHLHGLIGKLPNFSTTNSDESALTFGCEPSGAAILHAMPRVRVISDPEVDKDPTFKQAHVALIGAKRIYFLGFGWAPENLRRLIPAGLFSSGREVQGTAYGMGRAELIRYLKPLENHGLHVETRPSTCLSFLQDFAFAYT